MIALPIQITQMTVERGEGDFRPDFALFQEPVEEDDEMRNQFRRVIESWTLLPLYRLIHKSLIRCFPIILCRTFKQALDKGTSPAEFVIAESTVSMGGQSLISRSTQRSPQCGWHD